MARGHAAQTESMPSPLTTCEVARKLNTSEATVRRLDSVLTPTRTATGMRLYDPDTVERVAAERDARRAAE